MAVIALILFVNDLGVGLILPLLPFYAINMGASPSVIGVLIATLPFCAMLSGPPLGGLSDRYGRKPILAFSVAGTLAGFVLLGVAQTLPLVFLSRIVDGVSAGNTSTARAAIADITSRETRTGGIGLTFAVESLGLILGPVLAGVLAPFGLSTAAFAAAGIAGVCLALTLVAFPETRTASPYPETRAISRGAMSSGARLAELVAVLRTQPMRSLVFVIFVVQLLITMMWGTLALYTNTSFGFGGREIGYVSAFAAAIGIGAQTGLLRLAMKVAREKTILFGGLLTMAVGLALLAAGSTPALLLVGVGLMAGAFNLSMPTAIGLASRASDEGDQGKLMGTASSAISLGSVLGPVLGAAIFGVSMRGTYLVAGAIALVAAALCHRR